MPEGSKLRIRVKVSPTAATTCYYTNYSNILVNHASLPAPFPHTITHPAGAACLHREAVGNPRKESLTID